LSQIGTFWLLLFLVGGLYLLTKGADHLVDGGSALALHLGVRPLLIGLTIVAFGTSAPELATCLRALVRESEVVVKGVVAPAQFALGNVVGSNICNLALVLGTAMALVSMSVDGSLIRRELPFLGALTLAFFGLVEWVGLGPVSGLILLAGFLAFCAWSIHESLRQRRAARAERSAEGLGVDVRALELMDGWQAVGLVLVGLLILTAGAELLVQSAGALAARLAIPEEFIGLTIVALGTSLPELATTLVAARKDSLDLALGNVVGSNIFNIGLVVGLPSLLYGWPVDAPAIRPDMLVMLALTVVVGSAAAIWRRLPRRLGAVLLTSYAVYVGILVIEVLRPVGP
jgi:cation:H+ antiporter